MFGKRLYDEQKYMIEFSVEDINDIHRPCRNIFYANVEYAYLSTEHVPSRNFVQTCLEKHINKGIVTLRKRGTM